MDEYQDIIPPDDITISYGQADAGIKKAVSLLLQKGDQFFTYAKNKKDTSPEILRKLKRGEYSSVLYYVIFDYVQQYGHLDFFKLVVEFFKNNTGMTTLLTFADMLDELIDFICALEEKDLE